MDARVVDSRGAKRFEFAIGGFMAVAYYRIEDGRVVLLHTEAPQEFSRQESSTKLAEGVLEQIRASGRRAIAKSLSWHGSPAANVNMPKCSTAEGSSLKGRASPCDRGFLIPPLLALTGIAVLLRDEGVA